MAPWRERLSVLAIGVGLAVAVQSGTASVKVHTGFDKAFDFTRVHTWGWNPAGAGNLMVARTADEDPAATKRVVDPIVREAVETEMPRRGLTLSTPPDVTLTYYVLLTIGQSAQQMGQFLPSVAQWGLPPFAPATTSLKVIEQGSLVFDLSAKGQVVWRGVGEAQIKMNLDRDKRIELIHEAVHEILDEYPPKK